MSYLVFQDDKLINRIEGDNLIVGAGNYDEQIEEALIGQCVGEPFSVEVTAQASEKRLFNITVDSINYFKTYELTEEFVKEKWGFDTVDEYYQSCKNVLIEEKKSQQKRKAERELLLSIARLCDFTIDKEEVAKYSMRYVQEGEALAYVYEMDLNLYIKEVLGKSVKEFYQDCYETGENEIKQYLVVGAIFADKNLTITQEEYNQMCKKMGYDPDEVKKNEYEDAVIKYSIMKEEVLQLYQ